MPGISTSFAIIETATQAEVATVRTIQRLNCRRWELDFTEPLIHLSAKWKRDLTRRRAKSRLSFSILLFVRLLGSLLCEGLVNPIRNLPFSACSIKAHALCIGVVVVGNLTCLIFGELKAWADAGYGRHAELARMLGVSRQLVSDWFAGRNKPTLDSGLKIQAFLKKQRRTRG
jgi:transcriptional regulator with XRE-family HTH domain